MNFINHFLTAFNLLLLLFQHKIGNGIGLLELFLFALIFGVLIDAEMLIGIFQKKPRKHLRSWIQEPFGLLFIGVPIGLLFSLIKREYFLLTVIPFAVHIVLDYITIHEVSPLAPFSQKNINLGIFKSFPKEKWYTGKWYTGKEKGISENWFTLLNIVLFVLI